MTSQPVRRAVRALLLACTSSLLVLALGALSPRARAQCTHSATYPPPGEVWSYTGALPANCYETYRVFVPAGTAPPCGWPVLIHLDITGNNASLDIDCLPGLLGSSEPIPSGKLLAAVLESGVAVITARATISTAFPDPDCPGWPDPGHGLFHLPGVDTVGLGSPAYDDPAYAMAEKDAAMVIQHVRFSADDLAHPLSILDSGRIAVHGESAGATALMWAACGRDRQDEPPFTAFQGQPGLDTQFDVSTRPDVAILEHSTAWWPIFSTELVVGSPHFGAGGDVELITVCPPPGVPGCTPTVLMSLGDSDPREVEEGSALWYQAGLPWPSVPMLMHYGDAHNNGSVCESYTEEPGTCPSPEWNYEFDFCFEGWGFEGLNDSSSLHAEWSGFAWKSLHQASTTLIISQTTPWSQANGVEAIFEDDEDERIEAMVHWLHDAFDQLPSPWSIFEYADTDTDPGTPAGMVGVPGTLGFVPKLTASGSLLQGGNKIRLAKAKAGAQAFIAFSDTHNPVALLGGVIVPGPGLIVPAQTTSQGTLQVSVDFLMGAGAPPEAWFQVFVVDPAAVGGIAFSNALRAVKP